MNYNNHIKITLNVIMKTNFIQALKIFVVFILMQTTVSAQDAKEIFINPNLGNDQNSGIKASPLKSLSEAAKRVNNFEGKGAITIYLAGGVYGLAETAEFNPYNL